MRAATRASGESETYRKGMKSLRLLFSCLLVASGTNRDPRVVAVLAKHAAAFVQAEVVLSEACIGGLLSVPFIAPLRKQPKDGRNAAETTLVPAGLSMVEAVRYSISLSMPVFDKSVDPVLSAVVQHVAKSGIDVVGYRFHMIKCMKRASKILHAANVDLRNLVPDFARPINGHVNFAFLELVLRVTEWVYPGLVDNAIFGFQPVATVPATGCHRPIDEPETPMFDRADNAKSFDDAVAVLTRKARTHCSPQDDSDRLEVARVTLSEVAKDFCVGPLSRRGVHDLFKDAPHGPRCIPAFGIWQKGKLRRIDDACRSLHNLLTRMSETIHCCGADLPARIAAEFARFVPLHELCLKLGTDDIASAYRILVSSMPEYNVAAVWVPASLCDDNVASVGYFALRGFNFGLKSAPVHLATLMTPLVDAARKLLAVPCGSFYDDVLTVDLRSNGASAQTAINFFFQFCGYAFAPGKHERLRTKNDFLGVTTSYAFVHLGYVLLQVKEKRRLKLLVELQEVLDSGKLSPAHAARLRGKLYFTTTTSFYGVGRAALQAFSARQYAKGRQTALDDDLRASIQFFIALLQDLPPYKFLLEKDSRRPLYIWSDAMWEPLETDSGGLVTAYDDDGKLYYLAKAQIAFAVYDVENDEWHRSQRDIGLDVIKQMVPGKKTYIGQLEALAAASVLETLPARLTRGRSAIMWIDNLSAKYGLQKGYSKVPDSGRIINAFRLKQASLGMTIWFEYVPSKQNIADLPSRGQLSELLRVFDDVSSNGEWKSVEYPECKIPDFSSWTSPMRPQRKRARTGGRGMKRSKVSVPEGLDASRSVAVCRQTDSGRGS